MRLDIQGHRGARGHAPENTLAGFAAAVALGASTLELDVGVTRDGVVVIHHDRRLSPDLARDAGGRWIEAPGPLLKDLTFAELQRYDVGRLRPGSAYARRFPLQQPLDGARIPRLAELFARGFDVRYNIETKVAAHAPRETLEPEPFVRALLAEVRAAGLAARTTIQSFDWRTLAIVEREAPDIATSYLTEREDADPARVRAAGARIWSPDFATLTPEAAATARRLGLALLPWTVNEPEDIARVLALQPAGIITDYPDRVRRALARL